MKDQRIKATYLIETSFDLATAAAIMAGEQSCGTFVRVPGETDELRERFSAKVDAIQEIAQVVAPTLAGAKMKAGVPVRRALVMLSWPFHNVGANLPNLMATVAGNLYELAPFSGLKLLDVDVPDAFAQKYPGPQFGIAGTRKLTQVYDRPIIGTIIKPSVGLTPEATAAQVKTLIEAGLDFIKDDELMGDSPHSPFEERVRLSMEVINTYANKTGKKPMFAFNVSGDVDDMLRRHDYVLAQGGTCIMASINQVGLSGVAKLRQHSQLPIHGHRNFWGALSRSEVLGLEFTAYQKIWRLAGIDHLHTNGIRNKFCESDESVIRSVKACLESLLGGYYIMPVISSGQWAGQAVDTYKAIESTDVMYVCGGGIVAHPDGIAAGVRSVRQAWEAAIQGISLTDYGKTHAELQKALEYYE
ncbi:ribulose-bisphosphate carboxylase large subunit family protein [Rhabdobacter roseus]|uniref:Ribulose-bisphosphate carboxylase large chain n=1 Tax=Rhabdobacter roseus TaxID=1655419 RepID=A0A840TUQ8_9BACT|nr:ribulose-bisphosphate carboxylase large subunit family protein [Rhabdobacter roseus]MBB5283710.1 ribulose-bisphosphate carboxylase large chain [Rhabdobacter roseus]